MKIYLDNEWADIYISYEGNDWWNIAPTVEDYQYRNTQVCIHCGRERHKPVEVKRE